MISTIIFDMDGVIIDSEPLHSKIEYELFKELGLDISREEHSKYVGRSDLWSSIVDEYKLSYEPDELHQRKLDRYLSHLHSSYKDGPIEGVVELIKKLNSGGKKLVLASSSTMQNIELVMEMFSISKYFSHKVSGADLLTSKPHPEIFIKAAEAVNAGVRDCLVIEDSENGVRAAKAAGMICVGYRNPNSGNQNLQQADFIIDSFAEFDLEKFDRL